MAERVRRTLLAGVATIAWACPDAEAQPSPTDAVNLSVRPGQVIHVTDVRGRTVKGRLAEARPDVIRLVVGQQDASIAAPDVQRVVWEKPDSSLNGLLIGAAVGAIPGIYYLIADPNECTGMCPEEYGLIAVGAAVGWFVDRAVRRKVMVFQAKERGSTAVVPFGSGRRVGLGLTITF